MEKGTQVFFVRDSLFAGIPMEQGKSRFTVGTGTITKVSGEHMIVNETDLNRRFEIQLLTLDVGVYWSTEKDLLERMRDTLNDNWTIHVQREHAKKIAEQEAKEATKEAEKTAKQPVEKLNLAKKGVAKKAVKGKTKKVA